MHRSSNPINLYTGASTLTPSIHDAEVSEPALHANRLKRNQRPIVQEGLAAEQRLRGLDTLLEKYGHLDACDQPQTFGVPSSSNLRQTALQTRQPAASSSQTSHPLSSVMDSRNLSRRLRASDRMGLDDRDPIGNTRSERGVRHERRTLGRAGDHGLNRYGAVSLPLMPTGRLILLAF
jgi:hypothetical protein